MFLRYLQNRTIKMQSSENFYEFFHQVSKDLYIDINKNDDNDLTKLVNLLNLKKTKP